MNRPSDFQRRAEVEKLFYRFDGLSDEALRAIEYAYQMGRSDTLAELGIEEEELPTSQDMIAWAT